MTAPALSDFTDYAPADSGYRRHGVLGNCEIKSYTHYGSPYARYGYSIDSSHTNSSSSITSNFSNSESLKIWNDSTTKLRQVYVQQLSSSVWRFVLEVTTSNANDRNWATIINGDHSAYVELEHLHSRTYTSSHTKYEWRGGPGYHYSATEIKEMRNNRSTQVTSDQYVSNSFQKFVFSARGAIKTLGRRIVVDGGKTTAGVYGGKWNDIGEHHLPPIGHHANAIAISPQVKNANFRSSTSGYNGFLREGDDNFGPLFDKIENCRVFAYLGPPVIFNSSVYNENGGDYITIKDFIEPVPSPGAGFDPATDSLADDTNWFEREIRDKSGFQVHMNLYYGLIDSDYFTASSPHTTLFLKNPGGLPGGGYGRIHETVRSLVAQDELLIEMIEGEELWNQRITLNGRNRPEIGDFAQGTGGRDFYREIEATKPFFYIFPLEDDDALNKEYVVEYSTRMSYGPPTYNAGYSINRKVKTRLKGHHGGSLSINNITSSNYPAANETLILKKYRDLNPLDSAAVLQTKIRHGGAFKLESTTSDGVQVFGTAASAGYDDTNSSDGAKYGALQVIYPYRGGESYRVTNTYTADNNRKIVSTIEGRVKNIFKYASCSFSLSNTATSQTVTSSNSGTELKGNDGIRLKFFWPASWQTDDANDIRGTVAVASVITTSNCTVKNTEGPIKTDNTLNNYAFIWDHAMLVPDQVTDGTRKTWSATVQVSFQNPKNSQYYTLRGTWTGYISQEYGAIIYAPTGGVRLDHNTKPLRFVSSGSGNRTVTSSTSQGTITKPEKNIASGSNKSFWKESTSGNNKYVEIWYEGIHYKYVNSIGEESNTHPVGTGSFPTTISPEYSFGRGWTFVKGSSAYSRFGVSLTTTDTYYTYSLNGNVYYGETTTTGDMDNYCAINNQAESMVNTNNLTNRITLTSPTYGEWQGPGTLPLTGQYSISIIKVGGD